MVSKHFGLIKQWQRKFLLRQVQQKMSLIQLQQSSLHRLFLVRLRLNDYTNFVPQRQQVGATIRGYSFQRYNLGPHYVPKRFAIPKDVGRLGRTSYYSYGNNGRLRQFTLNLGQARTVFCHSNSCKSQAIQGTIIQNKER